jgi:hypothetical protein
MEDPKIKRFDLSIRELLQICTSVFGNKEDTLDLSPTGKVQQYISCVSKYQKCYDRTDPNSIKSTHLDIFKCVYDGFKKHILNDGHVNDEWLLKGKINIMYGSNFGQKTQIIIPLSVAYNLACINKDEYITQFKNNKNKSKNINDDDENTDDIILDYPELIIYYVYQIFSCLELPADELTKINSMVIDVETNLDIEPLNINANKNDSFGGNGGSDFGGIMKFATNIMKSSGMPTPPQSELGGQNLGDAIGKVFSNEKTTKAIGSMFQGLGDCKDIGAVINQLVAGFQNTELTSAISETLQGSGIQGNVAQGNGKSEVLALTVDDK